MLAHLAMQDPKSYEIVGLLKVRGCCLFTWREADLGGPRTVTIDLHHCEACIAELKQMGPSWHLIDRRASQR